MNPASEDSGSVRNWKEGNPIKKSLTEFDDNEDLELKFQLVITINLLL